MEISRDEAIALLAFMMAGADGDVGEPEEKAIAAALAGQNIDLAPAAVALIRNQALRSFDGSQAAWRRIRTALGDDHAREGAFAIAVEIVMADRALEPTEMSEIQEMADHLDISRTTISRQLAKYA